jgi:hypothetical protein
MFIIVYQIDELLKFLKNMVHMNTGHTVELFSHLIWMEYEFIHFQMGISFIQNNRQNLCGMVMILQIIFDINNVWIKTYIMLSKAIKINQLSIKLLRQLS